MMDCPDSMRKGGSFATQFRCSRLHRTYSLVYLGSLSATSTRNRSAEQGAGPIEYIYEISIFRIRANRTKPPFLQWRVWIPYIDWLCFNSARSLPVSRRFSEPSSEGREGGPM